MKVWIEKFLHSENGATAIEYGLLMALVFLAIVGSVSAVGTGVVTTLYDKVQAAF